MMSSTTETGSNDDEVFQGVLVPMEIGDGSGASSVAASTTALTASAFCCRNGDRNKVSLRSKILLAVCALLLVIVGVATVVSTKKSSGRTTTDDEKFPVIQDSDDLTHYSYSQTVSGDLNDADESMFDDGTEIGVAAPPIKLINVNSFTHVIQRERYSFCLFYLPIDAKAIKQELRVWEQIAKSLQLQGDVTVHSINCGDAPKVCEFSLAIELCESPYLYVAWFETGTRTADFPNIPNLDKDELVTFALERMKGT